MGPSGEIGEQAPEIEHLIDLFTPLIQNLSMFSSRALGVTARTVGLDLALIAALAAQPMREISAMAKVLGAIPLVLINTIVIAYLVRHRARYGERYRQFVAIEEQLARRVRGFGGASARNWSWNYRLYVTAVAISLLSAIVALYQSPRSRLAHD